MKNFQYCNGLIYSSLFVIFLIDFIRISCAVDTTQVIEQCFGAIGNKCEGGGNEYANKLTPPAEDLGNDMKKQAVSVGSILHDNCCLEHPDGQHCKGFSLEQELMSDSSHCVKEWRKAVYNSRDNRVWKAVFGPYHNSTSGDDLTKVPPRKASLFTRLGSFSNFYSGHETVSTLRIKAPSGTALDVDDVEFCESGKFKSTSSAPLVGKWGICA